MKISIYRRWFNRSQRLPAKPRYSAMQCGASYRLVRPLLEALEDRTLLSVTIASTNNNGNGYTGIDYNQSGQGGCIPVLAAALPV